MFIDFRDIAGMGIIGIFVVGFFVLFGALTWPVWACVAFLTWLAIKFCK